MTSAIQPVPPETARIAAIILAAGYSSRMVEFKPLLPLGGSTAFERAIGLFRAAGIPEVSAVLGHRAEQLQPLAERVGARGIRNPHFYRGMFSSIVAGIRALPEWVDAAFILPVDIPLVRPTTVRQLAAAFQLATAFAERPVSILYPVFDSRRGHPPLIARHILDEAAEEGEVGPLSALLARYESSAVDLPVADQGILRDMDTRAGYNALLALAARREIPSVAECEAILANQHVDPFVIRHSRKVAEIAHRIALALMRRGLALNPDLVRAGALLHDLAKGKPDHAAMGAELLRFMQFPQVAAIVAAHTDLAFSSLGESAIVYLADKLVRGEQQVTISQRFQPALDRFRNDPQALHAAQVRRAVAQEVAFFVEKRLGAPLSTVLSGEAEKPAKRSCITLAEKMVTI